MLSILMYGGSGIISSEIVALALRKGHRVSMINRGNRREFMPAGTVCIRGDLRNEPVDALKSRLEPHYDVIIDFLAYTLPELRRNMELARGRCGQYVFVSSATVYDTQPRRYAESDPIGSSAWDYARNKAACERFLMENAAAHGFECTVIRPYVTYGRTRIPLQFGPLEYYTIIHRLKNGKPAAVLEGETRCTLTASRDFAVAAVGLLGNARAYGQAFHITGRYETTWTDALKTAARAFSAEPELIGLSLEQFRDTKLMRGLNAIEVAADKGRDMLFEREKLKAAVPEFTGETTLEEMLPEIVEYFGTHEAARKPNYAWDGACDGMLARCGRLTRAQRNQLRFTPGPGATKRDFAAYLRGRYGKLRASKGLKGKYRENR